MIALDSIEKQTRKIDESAGRYLNSEELHEYHTITKAEVASRLKRLLEAPIAEFSVINTVFFRSKWGELLDQTATNGSLTVLEVASGQEDLIPQTMARILPGSTYITANMNERLNEGMLRKTRGLDINMQLIKEDAVNLNKYIEPESVDIVAFQHGANDVLQAILCDQNGVDTIFSDWMETLPKMIEIVKENLGKNTFEENTKSHFLKLITNLLTYLRPDGLIAINHYMFQYDLDLGYPYDLWENLVPILRTWIQELPAAQEVHIDNYPHQWWLFLKKSIE